MHTTYEITIGNDTDIYSMKYMLESHRPAQVWAYLIKQLSPKDLRPSLHPWRGITQDWDSKVVELTELIDDINSWIPNKIMDTWSNDDPQGSLNRLHIHFPEQQKIETNLERLNQLAKYNDLIHQMESLYRDVRLNQKNMYLLICPTNTPRVLLEDSDYYLFSKDNLFGDLVLHYPHVGRHPEELYCNRDTSCPGDQIIPQNSISAYHTLRFFDKQIPLKKFEIFYHNSKLKWPYDIDDPKLAIGYINLGKLDRVNGQRFKREEIFEMVERSNKIIDWKVY